MGRQYYHVQSTEYITKEEIEENDQALKIYFENVEITDWLGPTIKNTPIPNHWNVLNQKNIQETPLINSVSMSNQKLSTLRKGHEVKIKTMYLQQPDDEKLQSLSGRVKPPQERSARFHLEGGLHDTETIIYGGHFGSNPLIN